MQGLALEGGGAKGAYQIGAYHALIKNGYHFKAITGTSIGSVNAALICQGDIKKLEELWRTIDASVFHMTPEVVSAIVNKKVTRKEVKHTVLTIKDILKNKGIDTTPFMNLLNQYIDEDKIRKSKIKFGLVTMRLHDFKPLELTIDEIPKGKLCEYIMASCYLPVFNMKRIIDDHFYLDGGFTNVLPITLLERMGCDEIVGIRLKKIGLIRKKKNKDTNVLIIRPSRNTGSIILLDIERNKLNTKLGYYDTLKILHKLDGNIYNIKKRSRRFYRYIARGIKQDNLKKLLKKYHVVDVKSLTLKLLENVLNENNMEIMEVYDAWNIIKMLKKKKLLTKDRVAKNYLLHLKSF